MPGNGLEPVVTTQAEPVIDDFLRPSYIPDSLQHLLEVAAATGGANITALNLDCPPDYLIRLQNARRAAALGSSLLKIRLDNK